MPQENIKMTYKYIFTDCIFTGNKAQIGGGFMIAVLITYYALESSATTTANFYNCTFNGNRAETSAAVEISPINLSKLLLKFTSADLRIIFYQAVRVK